MLTSVMQFKGKVLSKVESLRNEALNLVSTTRESRNEQQEYYLNEMKSALLEVESAQCQFEYAEKEYVHLAMLRVDTSLARVDVLIKEARRIKHV